MIGKFLMSGILLTGYHYNMTSQFIGTTYTFNLAFIRY